MKKHFVALSLLLSVVMVSCQKDEKEKEPVKAPPTKTQLITDGDWDIDGMRIKSTMGGMVVFDSLATIRGQVKFLNNGLMITTIPGETTDSAYWQLKTDSIIIEDMAFYIDELTASKFHFTHRETESEPGYPTIEIMTQAQLSR